jgi:hypothetical protein
MDTILWVLVFIVVLLVVALVLPARHPVVEVKREMERKRLRERKATCEVVGPCERPCRFASLNAEKARYKHRASIDPQFSTARSTVPNDYPPLPIGCCTYGKPLSKDLPVADAPMYKATASDNMYLRA